MVQAKTSARPSVAGKSNPPAPARAAKTTPVAAPGEALRRANRVKGGFLDSKAFEIIGARALMSTFEGQDFKTGAAQTVTRGNLQVEFAIEGIDDPVTRDYSMGSALPSEDGVTPADEGQFICGEPGKKFKGLHENCAASIFLNSILDKGGYDEDVMVNEGFEAALKGVRGVLEEYAPPLSERDKKAGRKPSRPFPIAQSIEGGTESESEASPSAGVRGGAPAVTRAASRGKVAPAEEPEADEGEGEGEGEGESLEDRVRELVVDLTSKGPITKTKLTQAIGKAFDGDGDKMKAVSMAVKDSFLKGMAGEGLISYDGREVGPAE